MKDNRFIELLNLYIDRQITGEEMTALEAEMQANPRRRALYKQYCQMHRATTLVYESFRNETTADSAQPATTGAVARIAPFEPQHNRRRTPWGYYGAGLAAACVALVFAHLNSGPASAKNPADTEPQKPQPAAVVAQSSVQTSPQVAAVALKAEPASPRASTLVVEQDYASMLAATRKEEQRAFASGLIQPSRSSSLFQDGVFDSQPAVPSSAFQTKQTSAQQPEFAAFQFQR